MGIVVYSVLWVMEDLYHQPYLSRHLGNLQGCLNFTAGVNHETCCFKGFLVQGLSGSSLSGSL